MSADRCCFIDTNILVYLLSADQRKADLAESILSDGDSVRIISTQVISEFVHTARRKARMSWPDIRFLVDSFRQVCNVAGIGVDEQDEAFGIAERFGFDWYDSLIVATALASEANELLSEDLQHGQRLGSLRIRNPFADLP